MRNWRTTQTKERERKEVRSEHKTHTQPHAESEGINERITVQEQRQGSRELQSTGESRCERSLQGDPLA